MATIAHLRTLVTADTSGFGKNLKSGAKAVSQFESGIASTTRKLMGLGAALVGIGGGIAFFRSLTQSADNLAKTADRLGLTTEALAGLHHAGNLAGVTTQTLDMAMQRMTRRLAEAAAGGGEAKNAIAELGMNAQQLAAMSPDQAIGEIAESLSRVQSSSDKVRLAFKFFDSEGVKLINMLEGGRAGLSQAQQAAERFGTALDRESIQQIESMNDAFTTLGEAIKGAFLTAIAKAAPTIQRMTESFTRLTAVLRVGVEKGLGIIVRLSEAALNTFRAINDATAGGAAFMLSWAAGSMAAAVAIGQVIKIGTALITAMRSIAHVQKVVLALAGPKGWAMLAIGLGIAAGATVALNKSMEDTGAAAQDASDKVKQLTRNVNRLGAARIVDQRFIGESLNDKNMKLAQGVVWELIRAREQAEKTADEIALSTIRGLQGEGELYRYALDQIAKRELAEANNAAVELTRSLEDQIATFDMGATEAEAYRLSIRGVSEEEIKRIQAMSEQLDAMREAASQRKELEAFANSIIRSTLTPLERFESQIGQLSEALKAGLLTWEQYARGVQAAREELENAADKSMPSQARFAMFGGDSVAAASARERTSIAVGQRDPQLKVANEQLAVLEQSREALRDIGRKLKVGT